MLYCRDYFCAKKKMRISRRTKYVFYTYVQHTHTYNTHSDVRTTHTCIYTYIHTYIHIYKYRNKHMKTHSHLRTTLNVHAHIHTCIHIHTHKYTQYLYNTRIRTKRTVHVLYTHICKVCTI